MNLRIEEGKSESLAAVSPLQMGSRGSRLAGCAEHPCPARVPAQRDGERRRTEVAMCDGKKAEREKDASGFCRKF